MVILGGIVYRYANPNFIESSWSPVSALLTACVVYLFFVIGVGFCAFLYPKRSILIIFELLLFISILFTFAIGAYSIVAGTGKQQIININKNFKDKYLITVFLHFFISLFLYFFI